MGSFETWDVLLQSPDVLQKVLQDGVGSQELPELVQRVKSKGQGTFDIGSPGNRQYYDFHTDTYKPVPVPKGAISLAAAKSSNKVIRDNESASI